MPPADKGADSKAGELTAEQLKQDADTLAKEAQFQAEAAKLMAERADAYAKERKAEERIDALGAKRDSTPKGSIDLWPELKLEDAALVKKIRAGECDGCISELLELAIAHPRQGPKGLQERGTVIEALKARGAKEPAKRE